MGRPSVAGWLGRVAGNMLPRRSRRLVQLARWGSWLVWSASVVGCRLSDVGSRESRVCGGKGSQPPSVAQCSCSNETTRWLPSPHLLSQARPATQRRSSSDVSVQKAVLDSGSGCRMQDAGCPEHSSRGGWSEVRRIGFLHSAARKARHGRQEKKDSRQGLAKGAAVRLLGMEGEEEGWLREWITKNPKPQPVTCYP